jgi:hypothetical protein
MRCEEKYRLMTAYKAEVERYSTAVEDLTSTRGKTSTREYQRLVRLSEIARDASEATRRSIERHVEKHGC